MVQPWSIGNRSAKTCPGCGAVYEVTIRRIPQKDEDHFDCEECGQQISKWNTTEERLFKKIRSGTVPKPTV